MRRAVYSDSVLAVLNCRQGCTDHIGGTRSSDHGQDLIPHQPLGVHGHEIELGPWEMVCMCRSPVFSDEYDNLHSGVGAVYRGFSCSITKD